LTGLEAFLTAFLGALAAVFLAMMDRKIRVLKGVVLGLGGIWGRGLLSLPTISRKRNL
jgi:hypothetical protein